MVRWAASEVHEGTKYVCISRNVESQSIHSFVRQKKYHCYIPLPSATPSIGLWLRRRLKANQGGDQAKVGEGDVLSIRLSAPKPEASRDDESRLSV